MPFYSSYPTQGRLKNSLKYVLDSRNISSFKLSTLASISPTTTKKIYSDSGYIPSPDVLEKICLVLGVQPGDILQVSANMASGYIELASGV